MYGIIYFRGTKQQELHSVTFQDRWSFPQKFSRRVIAHLEGQSWQNQNSLWEHSSPNYLQKQIGQFSCQISTFVELPESSPGRLAGCSTAPLLPAARCLQTGSQGWLILALGKCPDGSEDRACSDPLLSSWAAPGTPHFEASRCASYISCSSQVLQKLNCSESLPNAADGCSYFTHSLTAPRTASQGTQTPIWPRTAAQSGIIAPAAPGSPRVLLPFRWNKEDGCYLASSVLLSYFIS